MIEVDTVESDVDEEPGRGGADEGFEMSPFGEVDQEGFEAYIAWWRYGVGFDNDGGVTVGVTSHGVGFFVEVFFF